MEFSTILKQEGKGFIVHIQVDIMTQYIDESDRLNVKDMGFQMQFAIRQV